MAKGNHTAPTYENKIKAAWFLTTLQQLLQSFSGWLLLDVNLQRKAG
jgi:hypothetical protein